MLVRQDSNQGLAGLGQGQEHAAPVRWRGAPLHQLQLLQPVDHLHRRVRLQQPVRAQDLSLRVIPMKGLVKTDRASTKLHSLIKVMSISHHRMVVVHMVATGVEEKVCRPEGQEAPVDQVGPAERGHLPGQGVGEDHPGPGR